MVKVSLGLLSLSLPLTLGWVMQRPPKLENVLDRTVLPRIELREVTVPTAIDFVLNEVERQHPRMGPIARQIQGTFIDPAEVFASSLVIPGLESIPSAAPPPSLPPLGETTVTLSLRNIPADEALRYVCSLANMKWTVEGGAVRVTPNVSCCLRVASPWQRIRSEWVTRLPWLDRFLPD